MGVVLIATFLLAAIGMYIAYVTYRARQVTPTETEAAICCSCHWIDPSRRAQNQYDLGSAHQGVVENGQCKLPEPVEVPLMGGGTETTDVCEDIQINWPCGEWCDRWNAGCPEGCPAECPNCKDATDPNDPCYESRCCDFACDATGARADVGEIPCEPGCIAASSSAPFDPENLTGSVTFTSNFELKYAVGENDELTEAKMEFTYPYPYEAPADLPADTFDLIKEYEDETEQPIKIYQGTFTTDWETVTNSGTCDKELCQYTVQFEAKDKLGKWTGKSEICHFNFVIPESGEEDYSCTNLSLTPSSLTLDPGESGDVVFEAEATPDLPEGTTATYSWEIDQDCDGVDAITRETSVPTHTETFTYPSDATNLVEWCIDLEITADGQTLSESPAGACSETLTISQTPDECDCAQDGVTCDPPGDTTVCTGYDAMPSGETCRQDCTYCGDGILQSQYEVCDPAIPEGEEGYDANCQDDCTTEEQPTPIGDLIVVKQAPDCVELVAPNNIATFTITVTNDGTETQLIRAVSDTLPQGFTYNTGSSVINGVANTDDTGVTVESSGTSQLVTWENELPDQSGWTIEAGGTLTIRFSATAGSNATIGTNINEVTVTPSDGDPIPAQDSFLVAQTCTQPDTGIFDNFNVILIGTGFLVLAGAAYYTGFGSSRIAEFTTNSANSIKKTTKTLALRIAQPQKYSEGKIRETALKKIKEHIDGEKKKGSKKK